MTYPELNGTELGGNLAYSLVYANQVTHGLFGLGVVIVFFIVVLVASLIMQLRFTSRIRPEVSFLASSFATLGLATILEGVSGILSPIYFYILFGLMGLSFIWVATSHE